MAAIRAPVSSVHSVAVVIAIVVAVAAARKDARTKGEIVVVIGVATVAAGVSSAAGRADHIAAIKAGMLLSAVRN